MRDQDKALFEAVIESLAFPFYIIDAKSYRILHANQAALKGREADGITCHLLTHQNAEPCNSAEHGCPLQEVRRTLEPAQMVHTHFDADGNPRLYRVHGVPIIADAGDDAGEVVQMIEYSLDITDQQRAEKESKRAIEALNEANALKQQLLRNQETQLHLLSTPILEIWDGLLVAPVIGYIDSKRGSEITEALLTRVQETRCRGVIVDVTGIESMDAGTAQQIVRVSSAVRLMGADVIISGISPSVAQTMAEADLELEGAATVGNLKEGLKLYLGRERGR